MDANVCMVSLHYLIEKKIQAIILSCNFAAEIENDR